MSDHSNQITVLFFATLRDRAGVKSLSLDLPPGASVKDLKERLIQTNPNLTQAMETALVAINREYAFDETVIPDNAEVALFPPVSGG
jgi:molybdopterin converting factor subunit 1